MKSEREKKEKSELKWEKNEEMGKKQKVRK